MDHLPVIPEPSALTLAEARDVCVSVINWANECDDVEMVVATKKAFQVVAEYLRLNDASREAEATMRMLEVRIGTLIGPAEQTAGPGRGKPSVVNDGLSRDQRHEFRQMAAHPEVVEQVVEQSTEQAPPSRAKVLAAIKELDRVAKQAAVEDQQWKDGLQEQREWASTFKAKPGDDWRRRQNTERAVWGVIDGIQQFTKLASPADLSHALDTGLDHVVVRARAELTEAIRSLDEYLEVLR